MRSTSAPPNFQDPTSQFLLPPASNNLMSPRMSRPFFTLWRPSLKNHATRHLHPQIRVQSNTSRSSRLDRLTSRLPKRLQAYTNGLRNAPVSHIVSFLILHELTAVVPLVGLFALFHYTNYVPIVYMTDHFGEYVERGVSRFERYFRRKGWFGFAQEEGEVGGQSHTGDAVRRWHSGEQKYRILVEVALAYAATKALLPIRIVGSVWATPWFAGVLVRLRSSLTRK